MSIPSPVYPCTIGLSNPGSNRTIPDHQGRGKQHALSSDQLTLFIGCTRGMTSYPVLLGMIINHDKDPLWSNQHKRKHTWWYCWWFRNPVHDLGCIKNPVNIGIFAIPTGVGFLPSTVTHLSNEKNPGWLEYVGGLYFPVMVGITNLPFICGSRSENQPSMVFQSPGILRRVILPPAARPDASFAQDSPSVIIFPRHSAQAWARGERKTAPKPQRVNKAGTWNFRRNLVGLVFFFERKGMLFFFLEI